MFLSPITSTYGSVFFSSYNHEFSHYYSTPGCVIYYWLTQDSLLQYWLRHHNTAPSSPVIPVSQESMLTIAVSSKWRCNNTTSGGSLRPAPDTCGGHVRHRSHPVSRASSSHRSFRHLKPEVAPPGVNSCLSWTLPAGCDCGFCKHLQDNFFFRVSKTILSIAGNDNNNHIL